MILLLVLTNLIFNPALLVSAAPEMGSADRVGENVLPNTSPAKSFWKPNEAHCSVACEITTGCVSFSFGSNKCSLFNEQYTAESGVIEAKPGFDYYYYTKGNVYKHSPRIKLAPTTTTSEPTTTKPPKRELAYKLYAKVLSFNDAEKACEKLKGQLACVHSEDINNKLKEQLKTTKAKDDIGAWIGLQSKGTDGTFEWQDKSTIFYSKDVNKRQGFQTWIGSNPEDYPHGPACVRILPRSFHDDMGKWADEKKETCDKPSDYFFCEFPV